MWTGNSHKSSSSCILVALCGLLCISCGVKATYNSGHKKTGERQLPTQTHGKHHHVRVSGENRYKHHHNNLGTHGNDNDYQTTVTHQSRRSAWVPFCPLGASGLHPHPHDCTKFLQCANGQTYIQDCGPGTAFDRVHKVCDYKRNVNCASGCSWGCSKSDKSDGDHFTTKNHNNIGKKLDTQPTTSSAAPGGQSDLPHHADILCLDGITGVFPHPFDYTKFINCKNGNTAIQNCVKGTAFSISKGYCQPLDQIQKSDHVMYIVSEVSYEYSQTLITCPPGTEGIHLYPFDAEKYIKCVRSQMEVVSCSPAQVFSVTLRTCLPLGQVLKYERVRLLSEMQKSNSYRDTEKPYNVHTMVCCPLGLWGTYPHPFDGSKYIRCDDGRMVPESCSSGKVYSLLRKECEDIVKSDGMSNDQVDHGDMETTFGSTDGLTYIMCPSGLNGNFLHPFDCTKYIECSSGDTWIKTCRNGAVYSISRQACIPHDEVEVLDRVDSGNFRYISEPDYPSGRRLLQPMEETIQGSTKYHSQQQDEPQSPPPALWQTNEHQLIVDLVDHVPSNAGQQQHTDLYGGSRTQINVEDMVETYHKRVVYVYSVRVHYKQDDFPSLPHHEIQSQPGESNHRMWPQEPDKTSGEIDQGTYHDAKSYEPNEGQVHQIQDDLQFNVPQTQTNESSHQMSSAPTEQTNGGDKTVEETAGHERNVEEDHQTRELEKTNEDEESVEETFYDAESCVPITGQVQHQGTQPQTNGCQRNESTTVLPPATREPLQGRCAEPEKLTFCRHKVSGRYAHPCSCSKYVMCDYERMSEFECPDGTLFDSTLRFCDFKAKVKCNNVELIEVTQPKGILCPKDVNGIFPYPFSRRQYIECLDSGTLVVVCPDGKYFSISRSSCEDRNDMLSNESETAFVNATQRVLTCPTTSGRYLYPYDTGKYIECGPSQDIQIHSCPVDHYFSIQHRVCLPKCMRSYEPAGKLGKFQPLDNETAAVLYNETTQIQCPLSVFGVFPHPFNNSEYIKCFDGHQLIKSCRQGQTFSLSQKMCTDDAIPRHVSEQQQIALEYEHGQVITESINSNVLKCPPGMTDTFIYPFLNTRYIKCLNGITVVETCSNDEVYVISEKICKLCSEVMSTDEYVEGVEGTLKTFWNDDILGVICAPHGVDRYAHPEDLRKYVICRNGVMTVERCTQDKMFDLDTKECI